MMKKCYVNGLFSFFSFFGEEGAVFHSSVQRTDLLFCVVGCLEIRSVRRDTATNPKLKNTCNSMVMKPVTKQRGNTAAKINEMNCDCDYAYTCDSMMTLKAYNLNILNTVRTSDVCIAVILC